MRTTFASLGWTAAVATAALGAFVGSASAQSGPPGQCECAPAGALPGVAAAPAAVEPWQQQRWGIGLRLGSASLEDQAAVDGQRQFGTGGLLARYRWSRRLELELALDHGTQQGSDGSEGELELGTATLAALLHLRPQARWDWYLLAGVGASERRVAGAPDGDADARGHLALGVGLERRFDHLVLGMNVRVLAIAPPDAPASEAPAITARAISPSEQPDGSGGAQLTFTAGWYF